LGLTLSIQNIYFK